MVGVAIDIFYQEIYWNIDPAVYYISGEITYYFKSRKEKLSLLVLDLSDSLHVNYVKRGNVDLNFQHTADQLLTIDLGKNLSVGEIDSLTISYEGKPPSNGFGSFVQGTHNDVPIIWTLSEPYGVRDWWPGKQDLVDKIDSMDVFIITPLNNLAAGNGKLISIQEANAKLLHHWQHRYPIASYLVAVAVTNYAQYSDYVHTSPEDSIEILNYVYPENLNNAQQATAQAVDIMTFFNDRFGVYPFADEKYGLSQIGWGGGMERQTMSFMFNFSYSLMAHEMAHQWFGDKVTCGSWKEIWLNEGFATYLTGLSYEEFSNDLYWPLWKSSTSNSATSQPGGSVYVDDTTNVNRIFSGRLTYNKGSYLLHMLRWVNGDANFFQGVRNYLNFAGTAYDFATTDELKSYLEQESGKDLDEFFADWYYGQGYPSYHINWAQQQDSLIIQVKQLQSHPSVTFFEMPVPVWAYADGNGQQFVLQNTEQDQRFSVFVGDNHIDSLLFDPERWILTRDNVVNPFLVGIDDYLNNEGYSFHPNPAVDVIDFDPAAAIGNVKVFNAQGIEVKTQFSGNRLEVSDLPAGVYTMWIENKTQQLVSIQSLVLIR